MSILVKIWLVNGSAYDDYEMSPQEFSARIIGDDHGPPVEAWKLSFTGDDGAEVTMVIDPVDSRADAVRWHTPSFFGNEEKERDSWSEAATVVALDHAAHLASGLNAAARERIRKHIEKAFAG